MARSTRLGVVSNFFAMAGYSFGDCYGVLGNKDLQIQAGVKFRLDILEGVKALIRKNK